MALQSAVAVYVSANSAQAALATRPPTALVAINSGGSSSPRIIMAPAPEVGSEAMSDPTNGPLRSTTTCCHDNRGGHPGLERDPIPEKPIGECREPFAAEGWGSN